MNNIHIYHHDFGDGKFVQVRVDLNDPQTVQISATPYPKEHKEEYLIWRNIISDEIILLLNPVQQKYVADITYRLCD